MVSVALPVVAASGNPAVVGQEVAENVPASAALVADLPVVAASDNPEVAESVPALVALVVDLQAVAPASHPAGAVASDHAAIEALAARPWALAAPR